MKRFVLPKTPTGIGPLNSALILCLFLCNVQIAQAEDARVEFQFEHGAWPTHFCLITRAQLKNRTQGMKLADITAACRKEHDSNGSNGDDSIPGNRLTFDKTVCRVDHLLRAHASEPSVGCQGTIAEACRPRFFPEATGQHENSRVLCVENTWTKESGYEGRPRILIAASHPVRQGLRKGAGVDGISLFGAVVNVALKHPIASHDAAEMEWVGGHFIVKEAKIPLRKNGVKKKLLLRCGTHEIQTMPVKAGVGGETAEVHLDFSPNGSKNEKHKCALNVDSEGRFSIRIPYSAADEKKRLEIQFVSKQGQPLAVFDAQWFGPTPKRTIRAMAREVSFEWKRDCLYPEQEACPEARLPDVGLSCGKGQKKPGNLCQYSCGGSHDHVNMLFGLPTTVRFERPDSNDAWEGRLDYVGQTLQSYVSPENRQLAVDFKTHWKVPPSKLTENRGDRIEYIEVRSPKGDVHRIEPSDAGEQRVSVPWVRCKDLLTYRIHGDRNYAEGTIRESDGSIAIPHPRKTADKWTYLIALGGGLDFSTPREASSGLSNWFPVLPLGWIRAALVYTPVGLTIGKRTVWFEWEFGYVLSGKHYFPLTVADEPEPSTHSIDSGDAKKVPFNRFFFGPTIMVAFTKLFSLGLGGGIGGGSPLLNRDSARVGLYDMYWGLWMQSVIRISRRTALEIRIRSLFDSETRGYHGDYLGTPTYKEYTVLPVYLLELGIRFEI